VLTPLFRLPTILLSGPTRNRDHASSPGDPERRGCTCPARRATHPPSPSRPLALARLCAPRPPTEGEKGKNACGTTRAAAASPRASKEAVAAGQSILSLLALRRVPVQKVCQGERAESMAARGARSPSAARRGSLAAEAPPMIPVAG
jgi:hypothetical protein